jgi:hypothetical protein
MADTIFGLKVGRAIPAKRSVVVIFRYPKYSKTLQRYYFPLTFVVFYPSFSDKGGKD